ncbi:hypothetical protein ACTL6P_16275 [Endozoicomonas acroporae]|uniref:hypothetical protein n=1 Tax=Endozoicomonas acroporae TaxID=1701104 RepID=UPI000C76138F|nr:hypothetical protein [Endozoicomonas acroporae]
MFTNTKTLSLNNNVADIKFEKGRGEKTMKKGDMRHGTFAPAFKGNYPLCLQAIAGQRIQWQYMGESTMPPLGTGLFMAMNDNKLLQEQKHWVLENAIEFDNHH